LSPKDNCEQRNDRLVTRNLDGLVRDIGSQK
jgi:hypothetical protein